MRVADYIFDWLAAHGVSQVFMLPGGGAMHLCDALGKSKKLRYTVVQHEQAAAIAAEAWGQHTNSPGVALVTSGPGATNTVTGVAAAWIDSTPCLFLSGQCKRADSMAGLGVRQMGSQEVDIVSIVKPVTKYAVELTEPEKIACELEKAWHLATTGRMGPVWLSVPLDVQAVEIDPDTLEHYIPPVEKAKTPDLTELAELLKAAKRPLLLAGNGLKLAGMGAAARSWAEANGVPVLLTWKMLDFLPFDHPLNFGCPGGMGMRYSNFILQNCDLLLILGSRVDPSITAFNHQNFAPRAKKVVVDVDENEIGKLGFPRLTYAYPLDAFMPALAKLKAAPAADWLEYCRKMKERFPVCQGLDTADGEYVNSYVFIDKLSEKMGPGEVLVPESSAAAGEITYQAFRVKEGQKIKNAAGLGSMGFGLPYAIAACLANGGARTVLLNGDGAFQLNIQELETLHRLGLPVKIFIWDNGGYVSIRNMQKNMFDGHFVASDPASGFTLPDTGKIAAAYGLPTWRIEKHSRIDRVIDAMFAVEGPALCTVKMSPDQVMQPRAMSKKLPNGGMATAALEDMWPYLDEGDKGACMCWD